MFAVLSAQLVHAQEANKPLIGFSFEAMKGERWQTDLNSFEARAKQLGAEVISRDADGDDDRQLQQVQDMIKAGIKVLVLLPHTNSQASRMVDAAKALHDAQMNVLQPHIARGDIKVLADGYTKDWLPSEAYLFALQAIDSS